ncbi:MAG: hypothetical protein L0Z50_27890, partial [Verrucomicrobiales bacterium]|nr:hypothetical protein [Verrucomicrobiales bacterium]
SEGDLRETHRVQPRVAELGPDVVSTSTISAPPPTVLERVATLRDWLMPVWMAGFALLIVRLLAAQWFLHRTAAKGKVVADGRVATMVRQAQNRLEIRQPVQVLLDSRRTIPMVWGVFRPRLLLPAEAAEWDDGQLRSVVLHELAHIKRHDLVVQWITQVTCALHWFNPLVWFAAWRLHTERERACDDLVLAGGVCASEYATHLLYVATKLSPSNWTQAGVLTMARPSRLEGRLLAVLNERLNHRGLTTALALAAPLLALSVFVPVAMMRAKAENDAGRSQPSFGPVIERVLKAKDECMLDLDTDRTHGPVIVGGETDLAPGMDLSIPYAPDGDAFRIESVVGLDSLGVLPAANSDWDIAPPDLGKRLRTLGQSVVGGSRQATVLANRQRELPQSYFFRTDQGREGVLQILGFRQDSGGVKIRYKLAALAAKETEDAAAPRELNENSEEQLGAAEGSQGGDPRLTADELPESDEDGEEFDFPERELPNQRADAARRKEELKRQAEIQRKQLGSDRDFNRALEQRKAELEMRKAELELRQLELETQNADDEHSELMKELTLLRDRYRVLSLKYKNGSPVLRDLGLRIQQLIEKKKTLEAQYPQLGATADGEFLRRKVAEARWKRGADLDAQNRFDDAGFDETDLRLKTRNAEPNDDPDDEAGLKLKHAEKVLKKATDLHSQGFISEQELDRAKRSLEMRKAELTHDQTEVERLQLAEAAVELDKVTKLREQNLISQREVDQARAKLDQVEAEQKGDVLQSVVIRLRQAQADLARVNKLRTENLVSEADVDDAQAAVELLELEAKKVARTKAVEQYTKWLARTPATRAFVRLVVGLNSLTFDGEETTWEQLPELLENVANRASTVLEIAVESDQFTLAQVNQAQTKAKALSDKFGFEYLSYVGVHPLGSKGSPSQPAVRQQGDPSRTPRLPR